MYDRFSFIHLPSRGYLCLFFFSSRRRHTRFDCDWSSDVCSSDLRRAPVLVLGTLALIGKLHLELEKAPLELIFELVHEARPALPGKLRTCIAPRPPHHRPLLAHAVEPVVGYVAPRPVPHHLPPPVLHQGPVLLRRDPMPGGRIVQPGLGHLLLLLRRSACLLEGIERRE